MKSEESSELAQDPDDVLLRILEGADELSYSSQEGNISERSREILATDFADYLLRRARGQL